MTEASTATFQTLTAEVTTMVIGPRQVTMSIYNQLDQVNYSEVEAWGRVKPGKG